MIIKITHIVPSFIDNVETSIRTKDLVGGERLMLVVKYHMKSTMTSVNFIPHKPNNSLLSS